MIHSPFSKNRAAALGCLLALCIFSGLAPQRAFGSDVTPTFDLQALAHAVENSGADTIEKVLPLLPETMRHNVSFIFKPEGAQDGDTSDPRAILHDERGRFSIAFNGRQGQAGFDRLEMWQFDSTSRKFAFSEQTFPLPRDSAGKPIFKPTEPTTCKTCHGNDPRPIWAQYPKWPGAFGASDDRIKDGEIGPYPQFIARALAHPRYRHLFPALPWNNYPFRPSEVLEPQALDTAFHYRPNQRLGALAARLNALRVVRILSSSEAYQTRKTEYAYAFLGCEGGGGFYRQSPEQQRNFLGLLSEAGLSRHDLDIRYAVGDPDLDQIPLSDPYFEGTATMYEFVANLILRELSADKPELNEAYLPRAMMEKYSADTERNRLDWPFFKSMDELTLWIPTPYPDAQRLPMHREGFTPRLRQNYAKACGLLAKAMGR